MPEEQSWVDKVFKGVGDAITDIREKLVEEPMYGRALSEGQQEAPQWPQAREESFTQGVEQERERQRDTEIDR